MFLHYDFVHACCAKNFKFIGFVWKLLSMQRIIVNNS
jgi:hypothetical protein